jgi:hypothetical protein
MLFKILHGDKARISTNITPYHEGYCYVTYDGDFYVDMNNERVKLNAQNAETLCGKTLEELKAELSSQPDWEQNDPDAPDYIKNRTHWVEGEEPEVIFDQTVSTSGVGLVHLETIQLSKPLVEGQQYLVTFNGTEYLLTAGLDGDFVYIGDASYEYITAPFIISNDTDGTQLLETESNGTWNIKIQTGCGVIHQLDEKFIPDSIARVNNWETIYSSGAITKQVSAFAGINIYGYKSIMVAIKCVNTTNSSGGTGGAISFVGTNGKSYSFRNILPDLIKNTTGTTGGLAIFRIVDDYIICENAMRSTNAANMLSTTDGAGGDNLTPVGGGVVRCAYPISTLTITNTNSSSSHYFGANSSIVVWGCKA